MQQRLSASLLTWLRAFESVARHGNFTRAAEELAISQSAVSQQVRSLEGYLGVMLLDRRPRSVTLSAEGARLAEVAGETFDKLKATVADIAAPNGAMPVTLSCSPSFAMRWVTPRLGELQRAGLGVDLRVFGEFHELTPQQMANERLQAAIRYDTGMHAGLAELRFLDEYLVPVASQDFIQRHPQACTAQGLRSEWLLHDTRPWAGSGEFDEWQAWLDHHGVALPDLDAGRRFNMAQLALGAARAGEGIALGRLALVMEELDAGDLLAAVPVAVKSPADYYFLAPASHGRKIDAIEDWLVHQARGFAQARARTCARLGIRLETA